MIIKPLETVVKPGGDKNLNSEGSWAVSKLIEVILGRKQFLMCTDISSITV